MKVTQNSTCRCKLYLTTCQLRAKEKAVLFRVLMVLACWRFCFAFACKKAAWQSDHVALRLSAVDRMTNCLRVLGSASSTAKGFQDIWLKVCRQSFAGMIRDKLSRTAEEMKKEVATSILVWNTALENGCSNANQAILSERLRVALSLGAFAGAFPPALHAEPKQCSFPCGNSR